MTMTPELTTVTTPERPDADAPRAVQVQAATASSSFARISCGITPTAEPTMTPGAFWRGAARRYFRRFAVPALNAVSTSLAAASKIIAFLVTLYVIYTLAFVLSAVRPARPSGRLARLAARTRYALWQLEQQLPDVERTPVS